MRSGLAPQAEAMEFRWPNAPVFPAQLSDMPVESSRVLRPWALPLRNWISLALLSMRKTEPQSLVRPRPEHQALNSALKSKPRLPSRTNCEPLTLTVSARVKHWICSTHCMKKSRHENRPASHSSRRAHCPGVHESILAEASFAHPPGHSGLQAESASGRHSRVGQARRS